MLSDRDMLSQNKLSSGLQKAHRGRYTHRAHRVVHRARTALRFLPTLSYIFHIFSGWQGRGGLRGKHTTTEASTPSSSPMVVVAAHTPCQGRAVGRGRRGCRTLWYVRSTEEPSAPQGAQACGAVSNVSRFAVLNALVSRFGVLLSRSHGTRAHHKGGANSGEVQKTAQGERKGCTRTWKTNAPRAHRVVHRAHRAYISLIEGTCHEQCVVGLGAFSVHLANERRGRLCANQWTAHCQYTLCVCVCVPR